MLFKNFLLHSVSCVSFWLVVNLTLKSIVILLEASLGEHFQEDTNQSSGWCWAGYERSGIQSTPSFCALGGFLRALNPLTYFRCSYFECCDVMCTSNLIVEEWTLITLAEVRGINQNSRWVSITYHLFRPKIQF